MQLSKKVEPDVWPRPVVMLLAKGSPYDQIKQPAPLATIHSVLVTLKTGDACQARKNLVSCWQAAGAIARTNQRPRAPNKVARSSFTRRHQLNSFLSCTLIGPIFQPNRTMYRYPSEEETRDVRHNEPSLCWYRNPSRFWVLNTTCTGMALRRH